MGSARAVKVIPAIINRTQDNLAQKTKKKVVAYARVSTDTEEQLSSYEAQVEFYTNHIKSNPDWEYVGVYTDEGISATNTKKRDGFNRMIKDALDGKVDMIITKSVSRFARNTVDTLTTVRQLKEKGVEVFFEKENIYTLDSKGELLITIMSSLAQEESRSISENVTWGQRKRFADGKVSLPYRQFLGYEKGEDGLPKIVEKEAKVIRLIYKLFLDGNTTQGIAKNLTESAIPTPSGKKGWQASTVESILKNEKYKGDAILQKTFTVDFLTKRKKANEGEVPMYYVENSHPAIIEPRVFNLVQQEFKKRKDVKGYRTGGGIFAGKIVCGECGAFYGPKVWHSNSKYRRVVWQCNHKFRNEEKCNTPHLNEKKIKEIFIEVFNSLIESKDEVLKNYETIIQTLTDTTAIDNERARLQSECEVVAEIIRKSVEENAQSVLNQEEYQQSYNQLASRYEAAKVKLEKLEEKKLDRKVKSESLVAFMKKLEERDRVLATFDDELWNSTVDRVTVQQEGKVTLGFKDGMELEWGI